MRETKFSCNNQLDLQHPTSYILRVKEGLMSKVHITSNFVQTQEQAVHENIS